MREFIVGQIPGLVMDGGPSDEGERLVMSALAIFADESGVAFPNKKLLAELSLQSERNLSRLLQQRMQQQGWLTIEKRKAGSWTLRGLESEGDLYRMNLGKLADRAERAARRRRGEDVDPAVGEMPKRGLLNRTIELDELSELKPPKPPYDPQGWKSADAWSKQKPEATANAKVKAATSSLEAPVTQRGSGHEGHMRSRWRRGNEFDGLEADGEEAALAMEARGVMRACNFSPGPLERVISEQLAQRVEVHRCSINDAGQLMVQRWRQMLQDMPLMRHSVNPMKFFREGLWLTPAAWPIDRKRLTEMQHDIRAGIGRYVQ